MVWRALAALFAAFLCSCGGSSEAPAPGGIEDWRGSIKTLKMGMRGGKEDPVRLRRYEVLEERIEAATGLPVKFYEASDYNGIIQAMASGQIDLASMGAGSYANLYSQIGERAVPVFAARSSSGDRGYYSTLVVRADHPAQSIRDLEGQDLAFVDFNSTSGYIYPRWRMRQQGIDPDTFFGRAVMGGGHLQTAMALANGQFDAVVINASGGTPDSGFSSGSIRRMARRGLVNADDFREIWFAGPIPNSPFIIRAELPQALQDLIVGAMLSLPFDDPETFYDTGRTPGSTYSPVSHGFYEEVVAMRDREIEEHKMRLAERRMR